MAGVAGPTKTGRKAMTMVCCAVNGLWIAAPAFDPSCINLCATLPSHAAAACLDCDFPPAWVAPSSLLDITLSMIHQTCVSVGVMYPVS
ncbi:hypothetical protein N657DRAFT_324925 [Parathielavia appendiculata]|uniref:Uncharacterized protein n=1 Tax=Parathielavia appendiculata TaxID=2587402 RepID=A0AAN6TQQ7_9PEZI|nr:hypothetical protein N657DRAFT_324925 [Parathielavia appendiculata]